MSAIRTLLSHAVDYAGLFPPARLGMGEAVANYAEYIESADAWALGRLVVPTARLPEFLTAAEELGVPGAPWRLTAIAGDQPRDDLDTVSRFNRNTATAVIDGFEFKVTSPSGVTEMDAADSIGIRGFAELPLDHEPEPYATVLRNTGIGAKFRTGGVVPEAFPNPDRLILHLDAVVRAGIPFKCTAGLHHPMRGRYRLTYEPGSVRGMMYGYLNVMLAAAALRIGADAGTARAILLEEEPTAFGLGDKELRWRHLVIGGWVLEALRQEGSLAFGSCSFREPIDELTWIPAA